MTYSRLLGPREAVALAASLTPDLILMDMHMPHCDGLQATKAIRAKTISARHTHAPVLWIVESSGR